MSKKKTALMQLIEILDDQFSFYINQGDNDKALIFSWVKNEAENLLEIEKQDLIDAYTSGQVSGFNADCENQEMDIPEDWLNETYESDGE